MTFFLRIKKRLNDISVLKKVFYIGHDTIYENLYRFYHLKWTVCFIWKQEQNILVNWKLICVLYAHKLMFSNKEMIKIFIKNYFSTKKTYSCSNLIRFFKFFY